MQIKSSDAGLVTHHLDAEMASQNISSVDQLDDMTHQIQNYQHQTMDTPAFSDYSIFGYPKRNTSTEQAANPLGFSHLMSNQNLVSATQRPTDSVSPYGVHKASSSRLQISKSVRDMEYCGLNFTGGPRPTATQRQDSGYFDLSVDKSCDNNIIEIGDGGFKEEDERHDHNNEVQSNAIESVQSDCNIQQSEKPFEDPEHGLARDIEHGDLGGKAQDTMEDLHVLVLEDVSLNGNPSSHEIPYCPRHSQETNKTVSEKKSTDCWDQYSGIPLQFLKSLAKFADFTSRYPKRLSTFKAGNSEPANDEDEHVCEHEKDSTSNDAEDMERLLYITRRSPDTLEAFDKTQDESVNIRLQVSRLWFFVKILALAVLLLSVAMAILCYKVHSVQCPGMSDGGFVPGVAQEYYGDDGQWREEVSSLDLSGFFV